MGSVLMGSRKCLEVFEGKSASVALGSISLSESSKGRSVCPSFLPTFCPSLNLIIYSNGYFLSANLRLKGLDKNLWLSNEISFLCSGLSFRSYLLIAESSPLVPFPTGHFSLDS